MNCLISLERYRKDSLTLYWFTEANVLRFRISQCIHKSNWFNILAVQFYVGFWIICWASIKSVLYSLFLVSSMISIIFIFFLFQLKTLFRLCVCSFLCEIAGSDSWHETTNGSWLCSSSKSEGQQYGINNAVIHHWHCCIFRLYNNEGEILIVRRRISIYWIFFYCLCHSFRMCVVGNA